MSMPRRPKLRTSENSDFMISPSPTKDSSSVASDVEVIHVRRVVAGNPNTPKQVLEKLAADSFSAIRRRVAENPGTPAKLLMKLATDTNSDVRLGVAENPHTPPETLTLLSKDEDSDVRYGVAENPHMPEEILIQLTEDENPYVRCRALKTLQMLSPTSQLRLRVLMQAGVTELPDIKFKQF